MGFEVSARTSHITKSFRFSEDSDSLLMKGGISAER
jgi:hypothetical protein